MFGTHLDISDRKQREEALHSSEKLLNRMGEVAGVGGRALNLVSGALTARCPTGQR